MEQLILAIVMLNVGLSFTLSIAYATLRSDTKHLNGKFNALATDFKSFRSEMTDFKHEMYGFKKEMLDFKDDMLDFKKEMLEFKDDWKKSHRK